MSHPKFTLLDGHCLAKAGSLLLVYLAGASAVQAQDSQAPGDRGAAPALEEVVITGSRIQRTGFETSTPVNVVGAAEIDESGFGNIYDVLMSEPSIGVGLGGSNSSPGGLPNSEVGAAFVNLRGLGTDRSLVLVNGKRRVSGSTSSSAVDVSMIPSGLIERVEIITGGASAVYGADAVSGVVNLILKEDIDGIELSVGGGASTEGSGGERATIDLIGGTEFSQGRGSISFGVSYTNEQELKAQQRDFSSTYLTQNVNPDNTGPNDGIPDLIDVEDLGLFYASYTGSFQVDGDWYTIDPGLRLLDTGIPFNASEGIGAEGFQYTDFHRIRQEQEVLATHFNLDYAITDSVNFEFSADFGTSTTTGSGQPDNTTQGGGLNVNTLYRENPLIPNDLAALMDANGMDSLTFNQAYLSWGLRSPVSDRETYTVSAGLNGQLDNGWDWDVSVQSGRYDNEGNWKNFTITQNVANAIDVITDPDTGQPICRSRAAGCVPFFPLGGDAPSQAVLDYIQTQVLRSSSNEQEIASASLTGGLFDLPAGEVQFAAGLEHRKESLSSRDDGLAQSGAVHLFRGAAPQDADMTVDEGYLEFVVPLVANVPFVQQLDFETAVRFSDYDTIGGTTADKFGFNWALSDDLRIRMTQATSVRAPNLSELYSLGVTSGAFLTDPCDAAQIDLGTSTRGSNCAALGIPAGWIDPNPEPAKEVVTGGNPDLTEESSDSFTVGAVITPMSLDRFSLSLDYWEVEIDDAVGSFEAADIIRKCVDASSIDNPFCSLVTREANPSYSLLRVDVSKINVGALTARGVDVASRYQLDVLDGQLTITFGGTYLIEHEQLLDDSDPSSRFVTLGDVDNPRVRANLGLSYRMGRMHLGFDTRYIGNAKMDPNVLTSEAIENNDVPDRVYGDLILGYDVNDRLNVAATIRNIGDVDPPFRSEGIYLGQQGSYDNVGRFITLRANYRF